MVPMTAIFVWGSKLSRKHCTKWDTSKAISTKTYSSFSEVTLSGTKQLWP